MTDPTSATPSVGAALKAARMKKSQTLETAAQQTRIPRKHLDALEAGRYDDLPAPVYLRGFLKSYCDFLDIPFDPLWRQLEAEMAGESAASDSAPSQAPSGKTSAPEAPRKASLRPPHHPARHPEPQPEEGGDAPLAVAFALASALAVLGGAWALQGVVTHHPAEPERPALPSALKPIAAAPKPPLTLALAEDAWLSVSLDGRVRFSGRAPRGATQEWSADKAITLRTNRPAALKLSAKSEPLALPAPDASGAYRLE